MLVNLFRFEDHGILGFLTVTGLLALALYMIWARFHKPSQPKSGIKPAPKV